MNAATPLVTCVSATRRPSSVSGSVAPSDARVLIVDDDDDARRAAAEALRAAGFRVEEVSNGLDALKAFQAIRPHIALLEVMTPFVDGYSTCRAMRDLPGGEKTAIVMMTDLDDIESLRFGYDAGATDFITKPVNPIILQHRVRYMLRASEAMDQLRQSQRKIAHLAYHDALTGLPNRRSLERYMARLREAPPADPTGRGALFLLDLDGFKRVNDTFGHSAGDELICEVGRRVVECFEISESAGSDTVEGRVPDRILARLGGDEFVFIDRTVRSPEDAIAVAHRLLTSISDSADLRGHEITITASIGVALVEEVGSDIEVLIQSADAAMYDAKAHDRNNARFYSRALSEKARKQLDIENALRHAISLNQFELHYQPKVDLRSLQVTGAEALLRWRHPERGYVHPPDFIAVAEESGQIIPIGRWVIREACRQAREWNHHPLLRGLRLSVNVSARQFRDPHFLDDVRQALADAAIDPNALELEITEGTLMNDAKQARVMLNELKAMGIWMALDDFGTGYSSLGYLRQFPVDTLKIDRSFVSDLLTDNGCATITAAIIAMANRLGLETVAEGVETEEHMLRLRELGCDQVQGYFFSRPLAPAAFVKWSEGRIVTPHALATPRQAPQKPISMIPPLRVR